MWIKTWSYLQWHYFSPVSCVTNTQFDSPFQIVVSFLIPTCLALAHVITERFLAFFVQIIPISLSDMSKLVDHDFKGCFALNDP